MDLPAELRAMIYKQVLVSRRPIDLWPMVPVDALSSTTRDTTLTEDIKHINASLLRVSRQLHEEAARKIIEGQFFKWYMAK